MVYYRPHRKTEQPMELGHNGHPFTQWLRARRSTELRPEQPFHLIIFLILEKLGRISRTLRQIRIRVCMAPALM